MKTLALIIFENQNEVSKPEIETIRKKVKSEFKDFKISVIANKSVEESEKLAKKCDEQIVFETKDTNNEVFAKFIDFQSSISCSKLDTIELN